MARVTDDVDALRAELVATGLGARVEELLALRRSSMRLGVTPCDEDLPLGASRIGGRPDLPAGTPWPHDDAGRPHSLVAQLDLAALQPFDVEGLLPPAGLLSFFYEAMEQSVWGFDPKDRHGWRVLLTEPDVPLVRHEPPEALIPEGVFRPGRLEPRLEWTMPDTWASAELEALGLDRDEEKAYQDLHQAWTEADDGLATRVLGHPEPVQGDMQLECQLASNGIYVGGPEGYRSAQARQLRPGAVDWRLLLQVDSEEDLGMMWGDVGRLYWWMRRDTLAARDFDRAWMVLQCC